VLTVIDNLMGLGKIRTDQFLANAALFHCAVLAYNTVRWMAQLSGNKHSANVSWPLIKIA
jgi:hypothetical protein